MSKCFLCGRDVTSDEIGLNKKMISREATKYMCKTCLSKYFNVKEEVLDKRIEYYKQEGCALFCLFNQEDKS